MFKTNALNSVGNAYVDEDTGSGTPGTRLEADDRNITQDELVNTIEGSGQTLDPSGDFTNNDQLGMAMAIYGAGGAGHCIDTGSINDYVLSPESSRKGSPILFDGLTLSFAPNIINNNESTVNYNGIGDKSIKKLGGVALGGGEISGGVVIKYNSTSDYFEIISSGGVLSKENSIYYPDPSVIDHGSEVTAGSIAYCIALMSGNPGSIVLQHNSANEATDYAVTSELTFPDNVSIGRENGALITGTGSIIIDYANIVSDDDLVFDITSLELTIRTHQTMRLPWFLPRTNADASGLFNKLNEGLFDGMGNAQKSISFAGSSYRVYNGVVFSGQNWRVYSEGRAALNSFCTGATPGVDDFVISLGPGGTIDWATSEGGFSKFTWENIDILNSITLTEQVICILPRIQTAEGGANVYSTLLNFNNCKVAAFSSVGSMGVKLQYCTTTKFTNVYFVGNYDNVGTTNTYSRVPTTVNFSNCQFREAIRYGAFIQMVQNLQFTDGCVFESNGAQGLFIQPSGQVEINACSQITLNNTWFENNNVTSGIYACEMHRLNGNSVPKYITIMGGGGEDIYFGDVGPGFVVNCDSDIAYSASALEIGEIKAGKFVTSYPSNGSTFVRRVAGSNYDKVIGDFVTDGNWHTLDLSAILPAAAYGKQVQLRISLLDDAAGTVVQFQKPGEANHRDAARIATQAINIETYQDIHIICSDTGTIGYNATNKTIIGIWLVVSGYCV